MTMLEDLLADATVLAIWFIEVVVLTTITAATAWAAWRMVALAVAPSMPAANARHIWLGYARWLVAGLTLQIGADILESSIAPSWQAIAQLGTIAVIRTFLNYFLERDIREVAEGAAREPAN